MWLTCIAVRETRRVATFKGQAECALGTYLFAVIFTLACILILPLAESNIRLIRAPWGLTLCVYWTFAYQSCCYSRIPILCNNTSSPIPLAAVLKLQYIIGKCRCEDLG